LCRLALTRQRLWIDAYLLWIDAYLLGIVLVRHDVAVDPESESTPGELPNRIRRDQEFAVHRVCVENQRDGSGEPAMDGSPRGGRIRQGGEPLLELAAAGLLVV